MSEQDLMNTFVATSKAKLFAYLDPELKDDLERLADARNRSLSNLVETLVREEIDRARQSGELPKQAEQR